MLCVIVGGEICSESSARVRSALGAGKGREKTCVSCLRRSELSAQVRQHNSYTFIAKGMVKKFRWRRGRNFLWCVEDDGRGFCSSDVHRLEQKFVSAAQMQFTHATRSPRARQIADKVACGSKVDIVAGISTRDSAATEKSFL